MLTPRVALNRSQSDQLAAVCELGPEGLVRVAAAINAQKTTIRRESVEKIIKKNTNEEQGVLISGLLFVMLGASNRDLLQLPSLIQNFSMYIERRHKGDPKFSKWPECRGPLEALLRTKSVVLAAKAQDVSYDFERVCLDTRILTSVRPIYDDDRQDILGATVTQTLRLDYLSPDGNECSLSIAVDMDDVKKLRRLCDEAVSKAAVAKKKVAGGWDVEAIAPGEETE